MFVLKFNDETKNILIQSLDVLARQIGTDLSKVGGNAAAEAAMKLIAVHNTGAAIQNAPAEEVPPAEPKELPQAV